MLPLPAAALAGRLLPTPPGLENDADMTPDAAERGLEMGRERAAERARTGEEVGELERPPLWLGEPAWVAAAVVPKVAVKGELVLALPTRARALLVGRVRRAVEADGEGGSAVRLPPRARELRRARPCW